VTIPVATGDSPFFSNIATVLSQMWQQDLDGYPFDIESVPGQELQTTPQRFQLGFGTWGADYPWPQDYLSLFFLPGASFNFYGVSLPEVTALLQGADATTDPAAALALYEQAEQILVQQVGYIPLVQLKNTFVVQPWVKGYADDAQGINAIPDWLHTRILAH
jgi:peptide/nickel transport system substrate-binding protein/oligopeptide transport system substrate-binding protein